MAPVVLGLLAGCVRDEGLMTRQLLATPGRTPVIQLAATATTEVATATPSPTVTPTPRPGRSWANVLRVWDGNTVLIEEGLSVRYIGVDTPGAGMFGRPLEPFGRQAAERNVALVEGKRVELEGDEEDVDEMGLLLRYVYVEDVMVNDVLLREGLARLANLGPNVRHALALQAAQAQARLAPLNIWTLVTPTPTPTATATPTPTGMATPTHTPVPPGTSPSATSTPPPGRAGTPLVATRTPTARPGQPPRLETLM
jgi:micrococcal nuclease